MGKISTYYKGDMLFESEMGNHKLVIDVPPAMGGSDRGPTPPEVFVASLGSCVAAFVAQYCERNGVNTTDLSVDVAFDKADDPSRLVNLKVTVNLPHGECKQRKAALQRVAEHCPVHETISTLGGIEIEILDKVTRLAA
ncbi:MAG: OsmC family protein [Chloroflexota bacterium]|jgi:putative redox protein|nr:OsmC family protein [Chloroflexota bacterium]